MDLDQPQNFQKIDKSNALGSIRLLADQMSQSWEEASTIKIPQQYANTKNAIICGMGGSALGARITDALKDTLARTPIEIFTRYHIPSYTGPNTLAILSSYSGNTQEILSAAHEALTKKAQIIVITTGGKLAQIAKENSLPNYTINPTHNPSKQPRLALGYSTVSILAILSKCSFFTLSESEMQQTIKDTRSFLVSFGPDTPAHQNPAKKLALELKYKLPILVSSSHLTGSAHAFKNQLNEGAKTFSASFDIPELNHHLIESLKNPAQMKELLKFVFLQSNLYDPEIQKRYSLTKEVVQKNEINHTTYQASSQTKLSQAFEILALGAFTHYYLALLYQIDPTPIPWIDFFKSRLATK